MSDRLLTLEDQAEAFSACKAADRILSITHREWTPEENFRIVFLKGPTPTKNVLIEDFSVPAPGDDNCEALSDTELKRLSAQQMTRDEIARLDQQVKAALHGLLESFNRHTNHVGYLDIKSLPDPALVAKFNQEWGKQVGGISPGNTTILMAATGTPFAYPELGKVLDAVKAVNQTMGWQAKTMQAVAKMVAQLRAGEISRGEALSWLPVGVDLDTVIREVDLARPPADAEDKPKVKAPKLYPRCYECQTELSPELDAYYGNDGRGKNHCTRCRKELKIK